MGETKARISCRCPRNPIRTMDVATADGPVRVGVWAERNGLGITTYVGPMCRYTITHLRTGRSTLWLCGLSWRQAAAALALLADVGPWPKISNRVTLGDNQHQPLTDLGLTVEEMIGMRDQT